MIIFKEIEITGLFGESDIKIPIKDNRLILVGYNGIGKSTILNIFYYFISQQWSKLLEQDFSTISVRTKTKNRKLFVDRSALPEFLNNRHREQRIYRMRSHLPRSMMEKTMNVLSGISAEEVLSSSRNPSNIRRQIENVREALGVSPRMAEELVREFKFSRQRELDFDTGNQKKIAEVDKFLSEHMEGRILYLPTYRRIEKDIKTVFPEIEEELQRKLARRQQGYHKSENYIELVQFGMEDVKAKIDLILDSVKSYALTQINSLTTRYLRDVIRNEANKYEEFEAIDISEASLSTVFAKVDSALLSDKDKEKITGVVKKIRDGEKLLENEKYVAHYVLYLVDVGKNISKLERPIGQFVKICNAYLYGKSFSFDNVDYEVSIQHDSGRPVEMEDLSSGEKQIVSLFSHLILDYDISNYIVIDEPELSLSVDWQQRFLEDISNLNTCNFILAVTHSPFIFDNSLDVHTVDLLEHTKPAS